jgi:WD40 repeat protein
MPGVGESAFTVIDVSSEGGPVNHVAYSPDGSIFATAGEDGVIRVWDSSSGELIQELQGHENRATYVAFSPDDELIASAGDDGTVRLWDQVGRQTAAFDMPDNNVNSVEFSPDSTLLVATTSAGDVLVWDIDARLVSMDLEGHQGPSYHAIFSPDGAIIASGDAEGVVRLWDSASGELIDAKPVNAGPGRGDPILSIAFSRDSSAIVVGGVIGINDAGVQIWEINSDGQLGDGLGELLGHSEWGSTATLSPDDAYIFSAGRAEPGHDGSVNATARVWNRETGALAVVFVGYRSSVVSALFSPDGDELLTSDGSYVYIWPAPMLDVLAATFAEAVGVQIPLPEATPGSTGTPTPTRAPTRAPTPTSIPTATVAPTATPTVIPTATGTTISLEIFCTVITDRLNLRPGPGTNFNPVIQVLEIGELLVVSGRNEDATWLQVDVLDENLEVAVSGWVSAEFVFCVGEIDAAPIIEAVAP